MNKIYKLRRNKTSGLVQAVSEVAKGIGKSKTSKLNLNAFMLMGMLACSTSAFSQIVGGGAFAPDINHNSGRYDIHTNNISKNNGFNSFNQFDLNKGEIANMHFQNKSGAKLVDNLFNFINNQANINGTVNAVRNKKIGGNLYFLSRQGVVVGASGVINAGSLHIMAPTQADMAMIFAPNPESGADVASKLQLLDKSGNVIIPLNSTGSIVIRGKVNTVDEIYLAAQNIEIGYTPTEQGSVWLKTGVVDFSNLVNIKDGTYTLSAGLGSLGKSQREGDGNITLKAVPVRDGVSNQLTANIIVHQNASLDTTGAKKGNVILSAQASHDYSDEEGEIGAIAEKTLPLMGTVENLKAAHFDLSLKSNVTMNGEIKAKGSVDISANNQLDFSSKKTNAITVVNLVNHAVVEVGGGITSDSGNISIASKVVNKIDVSASASTDTHNGIAVALLLLDGKTSSTVDLKSGTLLNAKGGGVTIASSVASSLKTDASASATSDGGNHPLGAVGVNVTTFDSSANTNVHGSVAAKKDVVISADNVMTANKVSASSSSKVSEKKEGDETNTPFDSKKLSDLMTVIGGLTGKPDSSSGNGKQKGQVSDEFNNMTDSDGTGSNPILSAAGAVTVATETIAAKVNVGGADNADIKVISSDGNVSIKAKVENSGISMSAASDAGVKSSGDNPALSAGVLVANVVNDADVKLSFAQIEGKDVTMRSETRVEYQNVQNLIKTVKGLIDKLEVPALTPEQRTQWDQMLAKLNSLEIDKNDLFSEESLKAVAELFALTLEMGEFVKDMGSDVVSDISAIKKDIDTLKKANNFSTFASFYVRSTAKADEGTTLAGAGSVAYAKVDNRSNVSLVNSTVTAGANVDIGTKNVNEAVTLGGNLENKILGGVLSKNPFSESDAKVNIGGTFVQQNFLNNSGVTVGQSVSIEGKQINVSSSSDIFNVTATLGGGQGSGNTFTGMVSLSNGHTKNIVDIDSSAIFKATDAINLTASSKNFITNVAGSIAIANDGGAGVGAAVAINNYDVENVVRVKNNGNGQGEFSTKNLTAAANTGGIINAISLAGGVAKSGGSQEEDPDEPKEEPGVLKKLIGDIKGTAGELKNKVDLVTTTAKGDLSKLAEHFTSKNGETSAVDKKLSTGDASLKDKDTANAPINDNSLEGQGGKNEQVTNFSAAGSVSLNLIESNTTASIDGIKINLTGGEGGALGVGAVDDSWVGAWSGAAAISWQKKSGQDGSSANSVALGGAVAVNNLKNKVDASLNHAEITNAKTVNVHALSGGEQVAAALGLQVSKNNGDGGKNFSGGAAVSVNNINKVVSASLAQSKINNEANNSPQVDIDVTAYESDIQVTGGVQLAGGNQDAQVGATVGVANISNKVSASIIGGNYQNVNSVKTQALLATTQVNVAVAGGIVVGDGTALNGAVIYNGVNNDVSAKIGGAAHFGGTQAAVSVLARDVKTSNDLAVGYQEKLTSNAGYALDRGVTQDGTEYTGDVNTQVNTENLGSDVDASTVGELNEGKGALIVTAALAVSASTKGDAGGAAVAIDNISNKFNATVEDADFSVNKLDVSASSHTEVIGVAAGVAVGGSGFGGMGSVSWQEIENEANASIKGNTTVKDATSVHVEALNEAKLVTVAGQIAVGKNAAGAVLGYAEIANNAKASIEGTATTKVEIVGTDNKPVHVLVGADNTGYILNIAASGAVAEGVAVSGAVAVNQIGNTTQAIVDHADITNVTSLKVQASDKSSIDSIAGSVAGSGKVAIGGAVAYNEIGNKGSVQKVEAAIRNTLIETSNASDANTVSVTALQNARIRSIAGGVGVSTGSAAIQGAATANMVNKETIAAFENVTLENKNTDITIKSNSQAEIASLAVVVGVSKDAALGGAVAVNNIVENTTTHISAGDIKAKNVLLQGESGAIIRTISIAGSGSGGAGIAGSVSTNFITNNNKVLIDKGATVTASGNVGVVAQTDNSIVNYAGALAVGGTAGVGVSVSVNNIKGDTLAAIHDANVSAQGAQTDDVNTKSRVGDNDIINSVLDTVNVTASLKDKRQENAAKGVVVDASTTNTMQSLLVTAGVAGTASVVGTVNVNTIDGSTKAEINNTNINQNSVAGDVTVRSGDYTNASGIVGGIAGAGTAAVGVSSDTTLVKRESSATVTGKGKDQEGQVNADSLTVQAIAKQGISSLGAGVAIGGSFGGAGVVSVVNLEGNTKASVSGINGTVGGLTMDASHLGRISNATVAGGGGIVGAGLAVGVVTDKSHTAVELKNSALDIQGGGGVKIAAKNNVSVHSTVASVSGGGVGIAGSVQVNTMESTVSANVENTRIGQDENDKRSGLVHISAENKGKLTANMGSVAGGGAAAGVGVSVNTINNQVTTTVQGSSIYSEQAISVRAQDQQDVNQTAINAAIGANFAVGANILVTTVGAKLQDIDRDGESVNFNAVLSQASDATQSSAGLYKGEGTENEQTVGRGSAHGNVSTEVLASTLSSAQGRVDVNAYQTIDASMTGGGVSLGTGVSANASVAMLNVNRSVAVNLNNAKLHGATGVSVKAGVDGGSNLTTYQGTAGAIAVGAAYGRVNTTGSSLISIRSGNEFDAGQQDVVIQASDESQTNISSYGLTAGLISAGVIYAQADNASTVEVTIGNSNIIKGKNISVEANKANQVAAKAVGGAAGLVAGAGVIVKASDTGTAKISVGTNNQLTGKQVSFKASNTPTVAANAYSGAVSLLAGANVAVADVSVSSQANLRVDAGNTFAADFVDFKAQINKQGNSDTAYANAQGLAVGGYGSVTSNQATVDNKASVNVEIDENKYLSTTALAVEAENTTSQHAQAGGTAISLGLSAGSNQAEISHTGKTTVTINGGSGEGTQLKSLDVTASGSATNTVISEAVGGGFLATGIGYAAKTENNMKGEASILMKGNWDVADEIKLYSGLKNAAYLYTGSKSGSVIGSNFIKLNNDITGKAIINIVGGAQLKAGSMDAVAVNQFDVGSAFGKNYMASNTGFGAATANGLSVNNKVATESLISIRNGVNIQTEKSQTYDARLDASSIKTIAYADGTGFGNVVVVENSNDIDVNNHVILEESAQLKTTGSDKDTAITLAASDNLNIDIQAKGQTTGGIGVIYAKATETLKRNNTVDVAGVISSRNGVNLYASKSASGRNATLQNNIVSEAYSRSFISGGNVPNAGGVNISQNNVVNVRDRADVRAVGHIQVEANKGNIRMDETFVRYSQGGKDGESNSYTTLESTLNNNDKMLNSNNYAQLDGTLVAGNNNKQNIVIDGEVIFSELMVDDDGNPVPVSDFKSEHYITLNESNDLGELTVEYHVDKDYYARLMTRLDELTHLMEDYKGSDGQALALYKAEHDQLKARLPSGWEEKGLPALQAIELGNIVVSGGNIILNVDNVKGHGELSANGAPEITIENNSNLALQVNDLIIRDAGGEIVMNGRSIGTGETSALNDALSSLNTDKNAQAAFGSVHTDNPGQALISINNTWNKGSLVVNGVPYTVISQVEVKGNISNLYGDVKISSERGDIVIRGAEKDKEGNIVTPAGNIYAQNIDIQVKNGSFFQGYSEGMFTLSDPAAGWSSTTKEQEDLAHKGEEKIPAGKIEKNDEDQEKEGTNSKLFATGGIYISADYVNINGTIQSGVADYVLLLENDAVKDKITQIEQNFAGKELADSKVLGNKDYRIKDAEWVLDGGGYKYHVAAYYNPSTSKILIGDIASNAGAVYLSGKIISTGNGNIIALDGLSNVTVKNDTDKAIELGRIDIKKVDGLVSIMDTQKETVTEYRKSSVTTYDFSDIAKVMSCQGQTGCDKGSYAVTTGNGSYTYSPEAGLRYNWTSGNTMTGEVQRYTLTEEGVLWGLIDTGKYTNDYIQQEGTIASEKIPGGTLGLRPGESVGGLAGLTGAQKDADYIFIYDYAKDRDNPILISSKTRYYGFLWSKKETTTEWDIGSSSKETFLHSLKADYGINVQFIGYDTSKIDVSSNQDVLLGGSIRQEGAGSSTSITSHQGEIRQLGGVIQSDHVKLSAANGIGASGGGALALSGIGNVLNLDAMTGQGDINLKAILGFDGKGQPLAGNVNVIQMKVTDAGKVENNILVAAGNVSLSAYGSITQQGADNITTVQADRIDLQSQSGSIKLTVQGTQEAPVIHDVSSASVNAKAKGDVHLTQADGDMRVGVIASEEGDIFIRVPNGGLVDAVAGDDASENRKADDLLKNWREMGLIAGSEGENYRGITEIEGDISAYKNILSIEYAKYQALSEEDKGLSENKHLVELFKEVASLDDYLEKDGQYQAFLTEKSNVEESKSQYSWDRDQLLYAIKSSIINSTEITETSKEANLTGKKISIDVAKGVGFDVGADVFSVEALSDVENLKKLAAVDAADVTWKNGVISINKQLPVRIVMTSDQGALKVSATENVSIAATKLPDGFNRIYLDAIYTQGNVRLMGVDGIQNVRDDLLANIKGKDLLIVGGALNEGETQEDNDIGASGKAIVIEMNGEVTARTEGSIYLHQVGSDDLTLGVVYAGGKVELISDNNIVSADTYNPDDIPRYINAADGIKLAAAGTIGTDEQGLIIKNQELGSALIEAQAKSVNLYGYTQKILGEEQEGLGLTLGNVLASDAQGAVVVQSQASISVTADVSAQKNVILNASEQLVQGADGRILTDVLTASSVNGQSLMGDNEVNKIIVSNTDSGGIAFNNVGADGLEVQAQSTIKGDIHVVNAQGDLIASSVLESRSDGTQRGNIALINTGVGDVIAKQAVYAEKELSLNANNGHIIAHSSLDGESVLLHTLSSGNTVNANDVRVGTLLSMIADKMNVRSIRQREGYTNMLRINIMTAGNAKPIEEISLPWVDVPNGVVLEQLWAKRAGIHVNADKFYLPKIKVNDYALLSNLYVKAKIYGANPWRDETQDLLLWNEASLSEPWLALYFNGRLPTYASGKLLYNTNEEVPTRQRFHGVALSSMLQGRYAATDADAAFWGHMYDLGNYAWNDRWTMSLIRSDEELANSEEIEADER